MIKLAGFGSVFEIMYTDKMSISRYAETLNPDGTTNSSLVLTPVITDIPCRISFSRNDNPESLNDDANPIFLQIKVFCEVGVDLRKGDYIIANRLDDDGVTVLATYEGKSNLPLVYVTHKEAELVKTGDA